MTGFFTWRAVGKLCSLGYRQPIFTPEDKQVGSHPRRERREGELLRTPWAAELRANKLGSKMNIVNKIFSTLNKF
jgi:hypothetical protein